MDESSIPGLSPNVIKKVNFVGLEGSSAVGRHDRGEERMERKRQAKARVELTR